MKEHEGKSGYEQGRIFYVRKLEENQKRQNEAINDYDKILAIEEEELFELKLAQLERREKILK